MKDHTNTEIRFGPTHIQRRGQPPARPCCERDHNRDGNCDIHPQGSKLAHLECFLECSELSDLRLMRDHLKQKIAEERQSSIHRQRAPISPGPIYNDDMRSLERWLNLLEKLLKNLP